MHMFRIFKGVDIFKWLNPSFAYFNYIKCICMRNTDLTSSLHRSTLKDSNKLWFVFFRGLYYFL
jgi:hypothetical protein